MVYNRHFFSWSRVHSLFIDFTMPINFMIDLLFGWKLILWYCIHYLNHQLLKDETIWSAALKFAARLTWYGITWASYQIPNIADCACAGNAGNVSPRRRFQRKPLVSDPGMHHGTCVTHVPWCMSGSHACSDGENVPGIPGACAPAILRIWQEAHGMIFKRYPEVYNRYDKQRLKIYMGYLL